MGLQDTMYKDTPAVIRDVTAAQFAVQRLQAPSQAQSGIIYRVDGQSMYYWNGSAWVGGVTAVEDSTGGIEVLGPNNRRLLRTRDVRESRPRIVKNIINDFTLTSGVTRTVDNNFGYAGRSSLKCDITGGSRQLYIPDPAADELWIGDADTINFRVYVSENGLPPISINIGTWSNSYQVRAYPWKGWNYFRLRLDAAFYWPANFVALVGDICVPQVAQLNGYAYKCTTAGTTGATQPTWPTTIGATVSDGTAVWTCTATHDRHRPINGDGNVATMYGQGFRPRATDVRHIRFDFSSGYVGKTVWFDQHLTCGGSERSRIIMTFDNWTGAHDRFILPAMNKYNLKSGLCFQDASLTSGPVNYLANAIRYYADGHDMIPNDIMERSLNGVPYADQLAGMKQVIQTMETLGFTRANRDFFALNQSQWDDNTVLAAQQAGLKHLRGNGTNCSSAFEGARMVIGTHSGDARNFANQRDLFDRAIEEGGTFNCFWHKFVSRDYAEWYTGTPVNAGETVAAYIARTSGGNLGLDADSTMTSWTEDFEDLMAHLAGKVAAGLCDVVSPSEFVAATQRDQIAESLLPQMGVGAF